jgi:hypothetical protein
MHPTRLYRKRLQAWAKHHAELHRHLDPIPMYSPLRRWADQQLAAARRPDFRTAPFRQIAREQRERAELQAWLDYTLEEVQAWLEVREQSPISGAPAGRRT